MNSENIISLQSYINSGDYDDEEDYPDLNERLEAYKSKCARGLVQRVLFMLNCLLAN